MIYVETKYVHRSDEPRNLSSLVEFRAYQKLTCQHRPKERNKVLSSDRVQDTCALALMKSERGPYLKGFFLKDMAFFGRARFCIKRRALDGSSE